MILTTVSKSSWLNSMPLSRNGDIVMTDKRKPETTVVHRDSDKGQFVRKSYADRHPKTTEKQHIRKSTAPRDTTRRK